MRQLRLMFLIIGFYGIGTYAQTDSTQVTEELIPQAESVRAYIVHGDTAHLSANQMQIEVVITMNIPQEIAHMNLKIGSQPSMGNVLELNNFNATNLPSHPAIKHVSAQDHYIILGFIVPIAQQGSIQYATVTSTAKNGSLPAQTVSASILQ